ncbi:MAG: ribosomal-processing cysteine protease Prp [Ruminococcaceae bacterium]|nr:ribosomal-processing cysteine protease Prp [Oscillospiraceae bacterium]
MISAEFSRRTDGSIGHFTIRGHAGYADENDIVCASVSAVSFAICEAIEKLAGVTVGYEQSDGYLYVTTPADLSGGEAEKVALLLETLCLFLKDLAQKYGDYVKVMESDE